MTPLWDRDSTIAEMRRAAREGEAMTDNGWRASRRSPSITTIVKLCGSWREACRMAGLEVRGPGEYVRIYKVDRTIDCANPLCERKSASHAGYCEPCRNSLSTSGRLPVPMAFYRKCRTAEALAIVSGLAQELGRTPTVSELREAGLRDDTVKNMFGTHRRLALAAGLEPRAPGDRLTRGRSARLGEDERERILGIVGALARDLGRSPTVSEIQRAGVTDARVRRFFGNHRGLRAAAGLDG